MLHNLEGAVWNEQKYKLFLLQRGRENFLVLVVGNQIIQSWKYHPIIVDLKSIVCLGDQTLQIYGLIVLHPNKRSSKTSWLVAEPNQECSWWMPSQQLLRFFTCQISKKPRPKEIIKQPKKAYFCGNVDEKGSDRTPIVL